MRNVIVFFCALFIASLFAPSVHAQQPNLKQDFVKGTVIQVTKEGIKEINGIKNPYQTIAVKITEGQDKDKIFTIESGATTTLTPSQIVRQGDSVILLQSVNEKGSTTYHVYDNYRVNTLVYLALFFCLLVILIAWIKGLGSLVGLAVSLVIIFAFIVPRILSGADPLSTSVWGSLAILFLTTYLAHGISKQTTVALISTFIALLLTTWLASWFVALAHLSGFTEEVSVLQLGTAKISNLPGLLLGGIIIGALGALNDVTTTQAAAVFELSATNPKLSFTALFKKGFSIGREHVVSLVNTLVLAYAGSSLALFLIMSLNPQNVPWWVILNSEEISDEIVRTIAGSMGLILVVPIVTALSAFACDREVRDYFKETFKALR